MVQAASTNLLGLGIYTPAQAARLARVQTRLVTRWVHGHDDRPPVLRPQLPEDPDRLITFLDLVQTMAIRAIRLEKKIPLKKISEFVKHAEERWGVQFPFARSHATFLFDDDIVLRVGDRLIQMTGKYKDNDLIRQVAEIYMDDLTFGASGLAERYTPIRYDGREIVIDPARRFGDPLVMPCGYSVDALLDAVKTEGGPEAAAKAFGVEIGDIKVAQRYDDWLKGVVAA